MRVSSSRAIFYIFLFIWGCGERERPCIVEGERDSEERESAGGASGGLRLGEESLDEGERRRGRGRREIGRGCILRGW